MRYSLMMAAVLLVLAGCSKQETVKVEDRTMRGVSMDEQGEARDALAKAGIDGNIVSIEKFEKY